MLQMTSSFASAEGLFLAIEPGNEARHPTMHLHIVPTL